MAYLIRSGLKRMLNFLLGAAQWIAVILIVAAPIWLPLLVLILVLAKLRKRRLKKKADQLAKQTINPPAPPPPPPAGNYPQN